MTTPAANWTQESDRIVYRQFKLSDHAALAKMNADPEVMKYVHSGVTSSEATWRQIAFFLGHWQLLGYGIWALDERASGHFMGFAGLLHAPDRPCWPTLEIGWILDRPFWGKGFATEAARTVRDFAFTATDAERVCSVILGKNLGSIRIAEKIGQRFDRALPDYHPCGLMYSMTRMEWHELLNAPILTQ